VLAPAAIADSANDNRHQSSNGGTYDYCLFPHIRAKSSRPREGGMMRAVVIGGSLGGLTAALVLRDQGWEVDVLERSPNPLEGRGTGIVVHPSTVRYLVERAGKWIDDIGLQPMGFILTERLDRQRTTRRFAST
jgi:NADPH-dependent 2,4-dienoyl-CoA reductase/sulfur reductase-like enzyme